jgi:hypothetical protein
MRTIISLSLALWFLAIVPLPMQSRCYLDAQTGRMICCDNYGMCI